YRMLHIGDKDGYIRVFDDTAKTDDVISSLEPIAAQMLVGPLPMSKTGASEAMCTRLNITPAKGTDGANYQIFVGKTAEDIIEAVEQAMPQSRISGIIGNVLKITRPRARGAYFAIRIYSDGGVHTWAIDNLSGEFVGLGRVL
ncbi:MAG: hypothetical protein Q7T18_10365, partial [Sedimentisphaerales bacterium]|nr:hypothetical protein [Sedimentisphaerales bacterium]